jgi:hypothetical protein
MNELIGGPVEHRAHKAGFALYKTIQVDTAAHYTSADR